MHTLQLNVPSFSLPLITSDSSCGVQINLYISENSVGFKRSFVITHVFFHYHQNQTQK